MTVTYIGIGSNLGDRIRNCTQALDLLGRIPGCRVMARSPWYLTRPVGVEKQEWYLNGVACLECDLSGHDLLNRVLAIESEMGRVRSESWGPRIIDLDLLLFGKEIVNSIELKVPHPLMHTRRFVLVPMAQIAPHLVHPALCRTMEELLQDLDGEGQEVIPYEAVGADL